MANMDVKNSAFALEQTIAAAGEFTTVLNTANKFVDKNIGVKITVPTAGAMDLSVTDNATDLTMGAASDGVYSPTATISGTVTPATAGWSAASAANVSDTNVVVGKVNQSTLSVGGESLASGSTVNPAAVAQTVTITEGYNGARTVVVGPVSAGPAGTISSPDVVPTFGAPTYQNSGANDGKFTIAASGTVAAPTVDNAGYVSETAGTKNAGTISGTKVLDKITVGVSAVAGAAVVPAISKEVIDISGVVDAASGAATTTAPATGVYVKVKTAADSTNVTSTGTVEADGYGTTTEYTANTATVTTVNVSASADTYIPITEAASYSASIGEVASSNIAVGTENSNSYPVTSSLSIPATITAGTDGWFHTGTATGTKTAVAIGSLPKATFSVSADGVSSATAGYIAAGEVVGTVDAGTISAVSSDPGNAYAEDTGTVLTAGGYLTLTAGYYPATKISTATLVPDGTDITGHADYILYGHTALDEDGVMVTGSIQTYDGSYTTL